MRKSHKKIIKKMNKYLIHGIKPEKDQEEEDTEGNQSKTKGEKTENQPGTETTSSNQSTDLKNNNQSETSTGKSMVQNEAEQKQSKTPKPG